MAAKRYVEEGRRFVVDVDLVTGVLTVDPPEGLLELNGAEPGA